MPPPPELCIDSAQSVRAQLVAWVDFENHVVLIQGCINTGHVALTRKRRKE